jgi:C4-dicarboxylate-specific signal transduction histidine kinase
MSEQADRLRREELAFFGRVGAGVTHDMRNVLSIVGEYAGLLEDLAAAASRKKPVDVERLEKVSGSIARQVKKGTETMERFSRFAHAADEETASFDLAGLVENTAALAQRQAAQAGCRLQVELPEKPVPVSSNPFSVQRAVYGAVDLILGRPEKDEEVTLQVVPKGAAAEIRVSGRVAGGGSDEPLADQVAGLSAALAELGGGLETSTTGGTLCVTLRIPC